MTASGQHTKPGYEKRETSALKIGVFIILSLTVLLIIVVIANQMFVLSKESLYYETVLSPESKALREQKSREDKLLDSYESIDSENGIYRIPIDRAMKLMTEEAYKEKLNEFQ
jgi:hypothetical protein